MVVARMCLIRVSVRAVFPDIFRFCGGLNHCRWGSGADVLMSVCSQVLIGKMCVAGACGERRCVAYVHPPWEAGAACFVVRMCIDKMHA